MKSIQERRISKLLEMVEMAGSQSKLADRSGISASEISQMKSPKHDRIIGDKAARKLESCLALPENWMDFHHDEVNISKENDSLITELVKRTGQERSEVIKNILLKSIKDKDESEAYPLGSIHSWDSSTPLDDDEVEVPFFMDVELAAGLGSELKQENHGPKLRFSKSTLRMCGVQSENAVCVKVSGNSMEPSLFDGDVVGINLGDKRVVDGKSYAINHDGLLRIKRLYLVGGGGLRINSFNQDEHPDETLGLESRALVTVIGRVFWSSSIWK